ncbi:MAG: L,D-transpeptidase family protein [Gaiellaceae bacterium]|jgi:lipoprotein-anchoring transpeptidase ErfK/SrfK
MLRRAVILVALVALACAAAPNAARTPTIAPGVIVGGVYLGGLTSEPARARLAADFDRPIPVVYGTRRWTVSLDQLGAGASVNAAVTKALDAQPGATFGLRVRWSTKKVQQFVDGIAKGIDQPSVDASLISVGSNGPVISDSKDGIEVRRPLLRMRLERSLSRGLRKRIAVPTRPVPAQQTRSDFGSIVWVDRGSNTLHLYNGESLVRTLGVATGQSAYPTPSGMWHIVTMQANPWWIPPNSAWAEGEKPVPPGPGNPLGTRWMGLDAAGVGLHGTPDAASIGYSASHGCIRMRIPDAEWLFTQVSVGTPVYIT